jgi:predicted DNA-binding transcriptional regulator AlpA
MSEEDMTQAVLALRKYTHKDEVMTKYQAHKFLSVSRATFDNLVAAGELPKGEKLYEGDSNLFWKVSDLTIYRNNRNKKLLN